MEAYDEYPPVSKEANLVVFSAPRLSLFEPGRLAGLLEGKRINEDVTMIVTTNLGYRANAEAFGYLRTLKEAEAMVLEGVCFYILNGVDRMRLDNGWWNIVMNSAKLANIIKAHKCVSVLLSMSECVSAALSGKVRKT